MSNSFELAQLFWIRGSNHVANALLAVIISRNACKSKARIVVRKVEAGEMKEEIRERNGRGYGDNRV
jgi:hypothetical protein